MLDLQIDRPIAAPKDAATIILVRDSGGGRVEVFCVERSKKSRFLGGAVVFPGGKLDEADGSEEWAPLVTPAREPASPLETPFTRDAAHLRSLAVAAARETLEEAAMLLVAGLALRHEEALALRTQCVEPGALRRVLAERRLRLDLEALHPFARWITPAAEARRFDARFFVAVAPEGQLGAHDEHETMSSFWAEPSEVLRRWDAGEVQLAPPTHATLAQLATCATASAVLALARASCLEPICPKAVAHEEPGATPTMALVLPGDPDHDVRARRLPGPSRYVLRGDRWIPGDAPR